MTIRTKKQELGVKTPELETQTRMETGAWFPILFNIMSDSLYVSVGVAVRYNCQTVRQWRPRVSPPFLPYLGKRNGLLYVMIYRLGLRRWQGTLLNFVLVHSLFP